MHKTPRLRTFALFCVSASAALAAFTVGVAVPRAAMASAAVSLSLDDLAVRSTVIAKVTPIESVSAWEGGRIVTMTRLSVADVVAGEAPASHREIVVRTLGGRVDGIGQIVEGEPSFSGRGESIVFLSPSRIAAAMFVVGRAQGQLRIERDARGFEVVRAPTAGLLVQPRIPFRQDHGVSALDGAPLSAVISEARRAWEAGHAK